MNQTLIGEIHELFIEEDIKLSAEKFINALNKYMKSIKKIDYELLENLFELNLCLGEKSNAFWALVCQAEIVMQLPQDIKVFIDEILKDHLIGESYRDKLESFKDKLSFRYLIARCFIQEGIDNSDKLKLNKGKKIIESLICQGVRDADESNYDQLIFTKIDALLGLSVILSPQEAIKCVDQISKLIGKRQAYMNPIYTYRASLIVMHNAKEASRKEVRAIADSYQTKNMEILSIFIAIAALIFGVGGIVYKANSLNDQLILLGALSLGVVSVLAIMISMLRFKWVALGINVLTLIAIFSGAYYFLNKNTTNKANITQDLNEETPLCSGPKLDSAVKK